MRMGTTVAAGLGALALLAPAPASAAPARALRGCRSVRVAAGTASHVRTTYRCRFARQALAGLLHRGASELPRRRPTRNRWGCSRKGKTWTCGRKRPHRRRGRIQFRFTRAEVPPSPVDPLQRCVDLWNSDYANLATIGYHLAYHHMVTRVWIFELPNPAGAARCTVIGVVPETDLEFGNDGEVSLINGGWALMAAVPELGDPVDVQRRAGANANASMLPDGQLTLP